MESIHQLGVILLGVLEGSLKLTGIWMDQGVRT
jgi:hypothetical protein